MAVGEDQVNAAKKKWKTLHTFLNDWLKYSFFWKQESFGISVRYAFLISLSTKPEKTVLDGLESHSYPIPIHNLI